MIVVVLIAFIVGLLNLTRATGVSCSLKMSDQQCLLDLYESTNGEDWINPWPVNDGVEPCGGWTGVNCSMIDSECRVTNLTLSGNNLNGRLPVSIGGLSELMGLHLQNNFLTGTLPSSIGFLHAILNVDLQGNGLTGTIPSFANLTLLEYWNVAVNQLTGTLPTSLALLTDLRFFITSENYLTGKLPLNIGNLQRLEHLFLGSNFFSGAIPDSLYNLFMLHSLVIGSNSMTGSISPRIGNLQHLKVIAMAQNTFNGSLPSSLTSLNEVEYVGFNSNFLTGSLPQKLGNLSLMVDLHIDYNLLTGPLSSDLSRWTRLRALGVNINYFSGTLSPSFSQWHLLEEAYFEINMFSGSIPSTYGQWSKLQLLNAVSNLLTGHIPPQLGNLSSMATLDLSNNSLVGSIPAELAQLSNLKYLYLQSNHLSGSLQPALARLPHLEVLDVGGNALIGSLPSVLSNLSTHLVYLNLASNFFTGTLPSSLRELNLLDNLYLNNNSFSGTLSEWIGNWTHLYLLQLDNNRFSGAIPTSIGNLNFLQTLTLEYNQLSGQLPPSIHSCKGLVELYASNNFLTGTIPSAVAVPMLKLLALASNFLNGTIPLAFDANVNGTASPQLEFLILNDNLLSSNPLLDGPSLAYVDVSNNAFVQPLPSRLWNSSVTYLLLNNNGFYGSFPPREVKTCTLQFISLASNALTGTLPSDLASCVHLTAFLVSENALVGSVTGLFSTQPLLTTVDIANNSFTGSLDDIFAASTTTNLVLNAAYNAFTGSLPWQRLSKGQFSSLILTENCLTGELDATAICANTKLTELVLSGLHASPACRTAAVPFLEPLLGHTSSYVETAAIHGALPTCVFETMPLLSYVTLSGNSLTGSLPSSLQSLPSGLQGVDLSHNLLTGAIPDALLQANLTLLDLSFNRFGGTLPSNVSTSFATYAESQLSLQVNRLSGALPVAWVDAVQINVLEGNVFDCKPGHLIETLNIPIHDPLAHTYACGSSTTNIALLTVLIALVLVGLISLGVLVFHQKWLQTELDAVLLQLSLLKTAAIARLRTALILLDDRSSWWVVAIVPPLLLCGSLILNTALAVTTSAYAHMYVWVVAIALQEGVMAGVILLFWLLFICGLAIARFSAPSVSEGSSPPEKEAASSEKDTASSERSILLLPQRVMMLVTLGGFLLIVDVLPVFVVNVAYVYSTTLRLSLAQLYSVATAVSFLKLAWNTLLNRALLTSTTMRRWFPTPQAQSSLFYALLYAGLCNLILSPLITEALVSPNCFQYVFATIPTNTYTISGGTCYLITYDHVDNALTTSEYTLACMPYDTLIDTYDSGSQTRGGNYNMAILSTTSDGAASTVAFQAGFAYNFQCTFSLLQAFIFVYVYKYLVRIVALPLALWAMKKLQWICGRRGWYTARSYVTILLPPLLRPFAEDDDDVNDGSSAASVKEEDAVQLRWLVDNDAAKLSAQLLAMRVVSDATVALSFGVLFPPVGLLALGGVIVDLSTTLWMRNRLSHRLQQLQPTGDVVSGGIDSNEQVDSNVRALAAVVVQLDAGLHAQLPRTMHEVPRVLFVAAVLWSMALFDVVGRDMGAIRALWTFAVVGTMPAWLGILLRFGRSFAVGQAIHGQAKANEGGSEVHNDAGHDDEEIGSPSLVEMTKSSIVSQQSPLHSQYQVENQPMAE